MMEKELIYSTPAFHRVFSSALFDFFSFLLLTALLCVGAYPVYFSSPAYLEPTSSRKEIQLDSRLYEEKDGGVATLPSLLKNDEELSFNQKSEKVSSALLYCYTVYLKDEFEGKGRERLLSFFPEFKEGDSPLFSEEGERLLMDPYYDEAYFASYSEILETKAVGDLSKKSGYLRARRTILIGYAATFLIVFSLAFGILFCLVPFLLHRGKKTLGMRLTRLAYVDARGLSPDASRFVLRFLFSYFLIGVASLFSFGLPFCLSGAFAVFRKDRQNLSDYVCGTYLVDAEKTLIPEKAEEA